ncbi:MAG: hypothetical protein AAF141_11815 [Pseudomonadota bacterium]
MVLTGCMGTPVTSIPSLARIDFETTDVAQLAVAVRVPKDVRSAPEGAVLTMVISDPDNPQASQTGRFLLQETSASSSDGYLISQRRDESRVLSYRLRQEDIARFRALRALRFTANGERRQGSLTAAPRLCRTADWQASELPVSVYLKTSETGRFVPVLKNRDLRKDLDDETLDVLLPVCDKERARL